MANVQNCDILLCHHHRPIELFLCLQSYMEDHLKNKDRLEQEWVALCAYEAEPCATTVAQNVSQTRLIVQKYFVSYMKLHASFLFSAGR